MTTIEQSKTATERERVTILTAKDLEISYFCGSGKGGQARNKVASGVMMRHLESGAMGRASDSRSQHENKKSAFTRLCADPRMKFWISKKVYEVRRGETVEREIERETTPEKFKYEIKDKNGRWTEVGAEYFDSQSALEPPTP